VRPSGLGPLLDAALTELSDLHPALVMDRRSSFEPMEAAGLRIFFHWPPAVARAVSRGAVGGVLTTFTNRGSGESPLEWIAVSRVAILYENAESARDASERLAEWLPSALIADPSIGEVDRAAPEPFGADVLWCLRGSHQPSSGGAQRRADIGWLNSCVIACVVAFADFDPLNLCLATAGRMNADMERIA